ncbi:MAG: YHS domain-containing (seleno)protein [Chitinophagaceae bacterium]
MYKLIIIASFAFVCLTSFDQVPLRQKKFNISNGLALQGYDPVAYFVNNKALKGKKEINVYFEGIIYYFSNTNNKEVFLKNPKQYEPQYGGWCAYAMGASGEKVEIDPETFKIIDNKLFLFYHTWVNNTLVKWNKDEMNLHAKADANWIKLYK